MRPQSQPSVAPLNDQATKFAFSITEVVQLTGLCRTSIYEALKRGELLAHKRGTRTLILRKDLDHWLASWEPFKRKPSVGGDSSNA